MRNAPIKKKSLAAIMRRRAFVVGFNDAVSGHPMRSEYLDNQDGRQAWSYERGRHFGILRPDIVLKDGNKVRRDAIFEYSDLIKNGIII